MARRGAGCDGRSRRRQSSSGVSAGPGKTERDCARRDPIAGRGESTLYVFVADIENNLQMCSADAASPCLRPGNRSADRYLEAAADQPRRRRSAMSGALCFDCCRTTRHRVVVRISANDPGEDVVRCTPLARTRPTTDRQRAARLNFALPFTVSFVGTRASERFRSCGT
jgi:hypothetical protein